MFFFPLHSFIYLFIIYIFNLGPIGREWVICVNMYVEFADASIRLVPVAGVKCAE